MRHWTVSEVLPDGRVIVVICVHIGDALTLVMDVYDDVNLSTGNRQLGIQLNSKTNQLVISGILS